MKRRIKPRTWVHAKLRPAISLGPGDVFELGHRPAHSGKSYEYLIVWHGVSEVISMHAYGDLISKSVVV